MSLTGKVVGLYVSLNDGYCFQSKS